MPIKNYTTKIDAFTSLGEIQGALARNGAGKIMRLVAERIEELEKENAELRKALKDMRFAYWNKDADFPHSFEENTLEAADKLLEDSEK